MNKEDLVSVIMPTYNAGKYLADSMNSILNQTYKNLELLITDDASTDPTTLQLLKEYASKDERVNILYLKENHISRLCPKQEHRTRQGTLYRLLRQ